MSSSKDKKRSDWIVLHYSNSNTWNHIFAWKADLFIYLICIAFLDLPLGTNLQIDIADKKINVGA